jgi:hypothetical protein
MTTSAENDGRVWRRWVLRAMAVTATVTAIAWQVAGAGGSSPVPPGVPVVRQVEAAGQVSVLVVPNRPGWNLVHVGSDDVLVGATREHLEPARPRPGTSGGWAVVRLPSGRSQVWIQRGVRAAAVAVDTGRDRSPALDPTGADGPECAGAALGRLAAGVAAPVVSCPADELSASDAVAVRGIVRFLGQRDQRAVTLVEDSSPRSRAAARVVRSEAARAGMAVASVEHPRGPLVVVSGWARAQAAIRRLAADRARGADGAYLAPWLLHAPLLGAPVAELVALSYSPGDPSPQEYLAALAGSFPGEPASGSGYAAWLAASGTPEKGPVQPVRLFAASHVTVPGPAAGHQHGDAGWLPQGTITPVTTPLDAADGG